MGRSNNNNSASISFNINVPSTVIREYFDGLAKVEKAKGDNSSDMSTLTEWLPLIIPFIKDYGESKDNSIEELVSPRENKISFVQSVETKNEEKCEEEKCEKEEKKEGGKIKRVPAPSYDEEDEVSFDFGKIGAGFKKEGGLGDMMKMFAPMFQELTSGLGNMKQTEENVEEIKIEKTGSE